MYAAHHAEKQSQIQGKQEEPRRVDATETMKATYSTYVNQTHG
jgi:hypothetical protein